MKLSDELPEVPLLDALVEKYKFPPTSLQTKAAPLFTPSPV